NQGSNDVSVLFGLGKGDSWSLVPGPRLKLPAGNLGPTDVSIRDENGDGIADLVVTSGQSGTVAVLPGIGSNGVGTGFFADNQPFTIPVSSTSPLRQVVLSPTGGTTAFALTASGSIMRFDVANFTVPQTLFVSTPTSLATTFEPVVLTTGASLSLFVATT